MSHLNPRIPEKLAPEVFALASRLSAQKNHEYSLEELIQAGAEAQIPPELIEQAVREIQAKHRRSAERRKGCE